MWTTCYQGDLVEVMHKRETTLGLVLRVTADGWYCPLALLLIVKDGVPCLIYKNTNRILQSYTRDHSSTACVDGSSQVVGSS